MNQNRPPHHWHRLLQASLLALAFAAAQPAWGFIELYHTLRQSPLGNQGWGYEADVAHPMHSENLWSMIALPPTPLPYQPEVPIYYQYGGPLWSMMEGNGQGSYLDIFLGEWHYPQNTPPMSGQTYSVPSWRYPWSTYAASTGYELWANLILGPGFHLSPRGTDSGTLLIPLHHAGLYQIALGQWGEPVISVTRSVGVGMVHGSYSYDVTKTYFYYHSEISDKFNYTNSSDQMQHEFSSYEYRNMDVTNVSGTVYSPHPLSEGDVRRMMSDQNVEDFDIIGDYARALQDGSVLELPMPHLSMIFTTNPEGTGPDLSSAPIVVNIEAQYPNLPAPGTFHTGNPNGPGRNYTYNFNGAYTNNYYWFYYDLTDGAYDPNLNFATGEGPIQAIDENISSSDYAVGNFRQIQWHGAFAQYGTTGSGFHLRTPLNQAAWGGSITGWTLAPGVQISDAWLVTFIVKEFKGTVEDPSLNVMHAELELVPESAIAVVPIQ